MRYARVEPINHREEPAMPAAPSRRKGEWMKTRILRFGVAIAAMGALVAVLGAGQKW